MPEPFTAVVELRLGDREIVHPHVLPHVLAALPAPRDAGDWEPHPYGGDGPRIVEDVVDGAPQRRLETAAELRTRVLGYCYTFIQNQHDYGTQPQEWRIRVKGKIVDHGSAA